MYLLFGEPYFIQIGDVDLREAAKELDSEDKEEDEVRWRGMWQNRE